MKSQKNRSGIAGMFGGITATLIALIALLAMATGAGASLRQTEETPASTSEASTTDEGVSPDVTKGPQQVPPTPVRIVAEEAETGGATSTGPFVLVGDSIFDVTSVCLTNPLEGAQHMIIEGLRLDSATVRMTLRFDGGFRGAEVVVSERADDGTTMTTTEMIAPDSFSLADGRGSGLSNGEPIAFDTTSASISSCASAPATEMATPDADAEPGQEVPDPDDSGVDTDDTDASAAIPGDDSAEPATDDVPANADEDAEGMPTPPVVESDSGESTGDMADSDVADSDMADGDMASGGEAAMATTRIAADGAWLTVLGADPLPLTATCLDLSAMGAYSLRASIAATGSPIDSVSLEPTTGGMILVVRNAQGVVTHISGPNATQVIAGDGLSEVAAIAESMENIGVTVPLQIMMSNTSLYPCGDLALEFGETSDASGIGSAYVRSGDAGPATFMTVTGACRAAFPGGDALAVRLTSFDDSEAPTAFGFGRSVGIRDSTLIVGDRTFRHGANGGLTQIVSPDGMLVLSGELVDADIAAADRDASDHVMMSIAIDTNQIGPCPTAER